MGLEQGAFDSLLIAAGSAPSGDNTQPWRFRIDPEAGRIAVRIEEASDPSPMNAGQRMARIAVGAALENLLRAAEECGWSASLEDASPPDLAVVRLSGAGDAGAGVGAIRVRVTNRRPYDGRPVPAEWLDEIGRGVRAAGGVDTLWVVGRDRLRDLARLIGEADALMFGEPAMRRAFLAKVRFDAPPGQEVSEGLSLGSLEVSGLDLLALRAMPHLPGWVLKVGGAGRVFAAKARRLVEGASGLCLVSAPDDAASTDLEVGRAMQRAWLGLTDRGLAVQPMMSLPVLENVVRHADPQVVAAVGRDRVDSLGGRFRALVPELGGRRPAFLMRFGFAPPPSGRTGRLPLVDTTALAPTSGVALRGPSS